MVQLIGNSKQFVTAARENKLKGVVAHFLNGRLEAVDLVLNRNTTKSGATALKTLGMFPPKKTKPGIHKYPQNRTNRSLGTALMPQMFEALSCKLRQKELWTTEVPPQRSRAEVVHPCHATTPRRLLIPGKLLSTFVLKTGQGTSNLINRRLAIQLCTVLTRVRT